MTSRNALATLLALAVIAAVSASIAALSTPTGPAKIKLSPVSISFGSRGTETSTLRSVTLSNSGGSILDLGSARLEGAADTGFSINSACPTALAPGAQCIIPVTFAPTKSGDFSAALVVPSSVGTSSVRLTGIAKAPRLTVAPLTLSFPNRFIGETSGAKAVKIKNADKGLLRITSIRILNEPLAFPIETECPTSLESSDQCIVSIRFAPRREGIHNDALVIDTNAGLMTVPLESTGSIPRPEIVLSPTLLAFPVQGTETTSRTRTIKLKNIGTGPLDVTAIGLAGTDATAFVQDNECGAPIAPKDDCRITVAFSPVREGEHSAAIAITSNTVGSPLAVALSGHAEGPELRASPLKLAFVGKAPGSSTDQKKISVKNAGKGLLRVRFVTREGEDARAFIQSNDCGLPVPSGKSCTIMVSYFPSSVGVQRAQLVISTLQNNREAIIALEGALAINATAKPISRQEAFRFLNQATFGANEPSVAELMALGDSSTAYERWIDAQIEKPISLQLPSLINRVPKPTPPSFDINGTIGTERIDTWFTNALWGEDQLRQRVAWALSQIFVVSDNSVLQELPFATGDFYDTLSRHAFGNYRELLEAVTLHPAMGSYLSHLGNRRATPGTNLRPDENYAREMMQLFSIGLVQLDIDGSVKRNAEGQPLPTYDPDVIAGFARVFTGWHWQCPAYYWVNAFRFDPIKDCNFFSTGPERLPLEPFNQALPMRLFSEEHEDGNKRVLSYPGVRLPNATIPAGQGGAKDLEDALDNVFHHPNVGPFISKQLIQKLVTSNPSPDYIRSVAGAFNDDGNGVRGNLKAVVKAVLLHPEARGLPTGPAAGKLKEPLLRMTQFWRAYQAETETGRFSIRVFCCYQSGDRPMTIFGQSPNQSPSVFNFYSPFYAPPGEISQAGLVAPEMQLANENLQTVMSSFLFRYLQCFSNRNRPCNAEGVRYPFFMIYNADEEWERAPTTDELIELVTQKLLGDYRLASPELLKAMREQISEHERNWPQGDPVFADRDKANRLIRISDALYLVMTSPDYAWQR